MYEVMHHAYGGQFTFGGEVNGVIFHLDSVGIVSSIADEQRLHIIGKCSFFTAFL